MVHGKKEYQIQIADNYNIYYDLTYRLAINDDFSVEINALMIVLILIMMKQLYLLKIMQQRLMNCFSQKNNNRLFKHIQEIRQQQLS